MAFANLQAGMHDLSEAMRYRREKKYEREQDAAKLAREQLKEQQKQSALNALGGTIDQSLVGQTDLGQAVSTGVKGGVLEPKAAIDTMESFGKDRHQMLMWLNNKIVSTKDPTERQNLLNAYNAIEPKYNRINKDEAYWKTYGELYAKQQFGELKRQQPRKGSGGGGGGGGTNGFNTGPQGTIPVQISIGKFLNEFYEDVKNDEIYQLVDNKQKGQGIVGLDVSDADKDLWRERNLSRLNGYMSKNYGNLPPAVKHQFMAKVTRAIEQDGVKALFKVGTEGEVIGTKDFAETVNLEPEEIVNVQDSIGVQGKKKKQQLFFKNGPAQQVAQPPAVQPAKTSALPPIYTAPKSKAKPAAVANTNQAADDYYFQK